MESQRFARPVFDNPFHNIEELPGDKVNRSSEMKIPLTEANSDPNGTSLVLSKDVIFDTNKKTWLRLYIPRRVTTFHSNNNKLPIIFYYHGGGFVFYNANTFPWDLFCQGLAEKSDALVISVDYRLAPEHRLPAAYEDAMDGLHWLKNTQDEWVVNYSDLSNVYLFGSSSGGNIAYQAGLRVAAATKDGLLHGPDFKIKGLILHQPYFKGKNRTESEENWKDDELLPLSAVDKMFDLSLPKGVDHDHEYCNPWANGGSKHLDDMKALGWRVLVTGVSEDPLVDAARAFVELLEQKGIETFKCFTDGYHAIELFEQSKAADLYVATMDFISATAQN